MRFASLVSSLRRSGVCLTNEMPALRGDWLNVPGFLICLLRRVHVAHTLANCRSVSDSADFAFRTTAIVHRSCSGWFQLPR